MTPLRKQMIEAMQMRGFSLRTHESYLYAIEQLTRHYRRSPDKLSPEQIQSFFKHLVLKRELSSASCHLYLHGVRFFYCQVLGWEPQIITLVIPKQEQRIPQLLTHVEVAQIISNCHNPKHRMLLVVCYGCGLRVSELVALRVRDIDGERKLLRIEQGKGAKDRYILIAPTLLKQLRHYWLAQRPLDWLFPSERDPRQPVNVSTAQRVFTRAKNAAGIEKVGGIHSLRHAYATHQLENGLPVHQLQRLLGHQNLRSTMRYIHWVPSEQQENQGYADLIADLVSSHE